MFQPQPQWQINPAPEVPQSFVEEVKGYTKGTNGRYAAQLLWQRGIQEVEKLPGFLNPDFYQPASCFEFGEEMKCAVKRLVQAREVGEKVTIWGDFDADGITATSVLWEGLGQFFVQHLQLSYYIPNRLTESHGLNNKGIEKLAYLGTKLIVTCDTGSTNLAEINYAQKLGIEIIVTDHHTLPPERPAVVAIINPRYLSENHSLFHLSGVAVAYKLIEALYETLPDVPKQPVEDLLDLVAIGLIADLVQLSGDCRYLAQKGIQQLQKQKSEPTRPGVAALLELCRRSGDRPTDISFGLGPRINAVSRIQGDASFCVELLTSRDNSRTQQLALETELANTRRKELQKNVAKDVKKRLEQIDLSTTSVIVLADPQWQGGVLGLVAGQVAQEYGRPTILLSIDSEGKFARGSARSVGNIDLYELVNSQAHLLDRFGGHPFAAGLSLPVENLPLFQEAINQQLRQNLVDFNSLAPIVEADLIVTVAELGKELFWELKLLEPCGMGNPAPRLLIKNCWFTNVWNKNTSDFKKKKVQYIKTNFELGDETVKEGFPGVWWGHYKDELPQEELCDAIVELDFSTFGKPHYEVRLLAVKSCADASKFNSSLAGNEWILDWRGEGEDVEMQEMLEKVLKMENCPVAWEELQLKFRNAIAHSQKLALAYSHPQSTPAEQVWQQLVGIAKYLYRTGKMATAEQICVKLGISQVILQLGIDALSQLGFVVERNDDFLAVVELNSPSSTVKQAIDLLISAVTEAQFRREYFYQVPVATLEGIVKGSTLV
ncbi:MAG: single-stranded-DNA-specific exonuclease RecJ [Oscillatoria sp. PMC 1051.18]|nr:single-stranded-DNA-specific exonuclease RecJ [Oscillatoria sp. PMC 1050.18]MEC5029792.1 single-stranded-DNA-specific exonuclease RecJ [Oscillatoria sp. PMC 1051.18]